MSLYGYDGDQSGGGSPDGEVFEYGSGNYHAKVLVDSFETVNYDHLGNPRVKLVATMLAGSKIAETHTPTKQSKLVSKQRSEILGREDDIISKSPYKEQAFELKEDFSFAQPVSPSHITGVITGLSLNGSTMLKCSTGPYDGFPIGVVYACKHLTRELGIDVQPEQFRDWQTSYRAAFDSSEAGLELVEFVRKTLGDGNGLSQPMEEQITIEDLQTNATAATESGNQHEPNWGWSDVVRPTRENVLGFAKFMLRFHSRKVTDGMVREAAREFHNEKEGSQIAEWQFKRSHWPCLKHWCLWRFDHPEVFQMTEMGIGLATGQVSYEQFIGAFCDRWQYPQPFARKVEGVRIRPMVEVVRILKELRRRGYQAHLTKEEQHGIIYDVGSRADVDSFVDCVIVIRSTPADYPTHWQKPASGNWPHKAMEMVCWCLMKAEIVKKDSAGHILLQAEGGFVNGN